MPFLPQPLEGAFVAIDFETADYGAGIVVGGDVVNVGSDSGQLLPMVEPIKRRFQRTPKRLLADGDFAHLDDIATWHADHAVERVRAGRNVGREKAEGNDPYRPKPKDKEGVRCVAAADGYGGSADDLPASAADSRVDECPGAELGPASGARPQPSESACGGVAVRAGAQLDANGAVANQDGDDRKRLKGPA